MSRAQHHRHLGEREHGEGRVGKTSPVLMRNQIVQLSEMIIIGSSQEKSAEGVPRSGSYLE